MYTLAVNGNFIALHYLTGGDWGKENFPHGHCYKLEVALHGNELNRHGYLIDIVDLENTLASLIESFENKVLNDLPEFAGLNPSIENLARLACDRFCQDLDTTGLISISVTVWEDQKAWTRFRNDLQ